MGAMEFSLFSNVYVGLQADTLSRIFGIFWKCARIGERLSPYISMCCIAMAVSTIFSIQASSRLILVGLAVRW
jgi:hypothetical protein